MPFDSYTRLHTVDYMQGLYNRAKKVFRDRWENFAGEQNAAEEKVPDKVSVQDMVFWEWRLCIWPDQGRRWGRNVEPQG